MSTQQPYQLLTHAPGYWMQTRYSCSCCMYSTVRLRVAPSMPLIRQATGTLIKAQVLSYLMAMFKLLSGEAAPCCYCC